jgi:monoterpene epsilon-lactone hydrolase
MEIADASYLANIASGYCNDSWAAGIRLSLHKQRISWQGRVLRLLFGLLRISRTSSAIADEKVYLARKRASEDRWSGRFKPIAPIQCEPVMANGVPAEWIAGPELDAHDPTAPTILYLHGGSFTGGSIASHRPLCGSIAHVAQARTLLIEYRLAPEYPFPAALDDAVAAYRWLLETGTKPKRIVIAGDSSGGGLALSALIALRDNGTPLPAATVCLSPITDLACDSKSWDTNAKYELFGDVISARRSIKMYLNGADPRTPLSSPLYANLAGLPPLFMQVGTREVLLADSTRFAQKAHNAGVDVTLDIWHEMVHSWQFAAQFLPEGRAAIEKIGEFIKCHVGSAPVQSL